MATWLATFRREAVSFGGRLLLDFTADKPLALVPFIRGTVSSFVVFSAFFSSISTGEGVSGVSGLSTEHITNIKPTTITTTATTIPIIISLDEPFFSLLVSSISPLVASSLASLSGTALAFLSASIFSSLKTLLPPPGDLPQVLVSCHHL